MLTCLQVRHLAIIDALELEFGPGLNVITGETGAGKSILIKALEIVLGGRASADLVRTGHDTAEIEALFDLTDHPEARATVREAVGDDDPELSVRRVIKASGRSRAYINGRLATAMQLSRLTGDLVDICSQHEHHRLVDARSHLQYLDAFAQLGDRRTAVASAWSAYRDAARDLESLTDALRERTDREAILRFQLEEIDAVDPQPGERDDLADEQQRLAHAELLATHTTRAEKRLQGDDDALCPQLAQLAQDLAEAAAHDEGIEPLAQQLQAALTDLEDLAHDLGRYARGVVFDPHRLREIDERLAAFKRLERKYGGTFEAMLARRDEAREELAGLTDLEDRLDALEASRQRAVSELGDVARELSEARHAAADQLGRAITTELQDLGMGDAHIEVDVDRLENRGQGVEIEGATVSAHGMDRVEFLIAPNRGEPPRPLHRIASGGELSRSLLAIKRVLAARGPASLYVFDEVDSGVGGAVAEVIGRKLDQVAQHHQVLCITHQPQIAVYGRRHLHVQKAAVGDRTASEVRTLDGQGRVDEIARMMGGVVITDATTEAAEQLLDQAQARVEEGRSD